MGHFTTVDLSIAINKFESADFQKKSWTELPKPLEVSWLHPTGVGINVPSIGDLWNTSPKQISLLEMKYLVVHPTDRLGGLVHPSYFCGRLAPTYPIEITRVAQPTYDPWVVSHQVSHIYHRAWDWCPDFWSLTWGFVKHITISQPYLLEMNSIPHISLGDVIAITITITWWNQASKACRSVASSPRSAVPLRPESSGLSQRHADPSADPAEEHRGDAVPKCFWCGYLMGYGYRL